MIKTILLECPRPEAEAALFALTGDLAKRHGAHVVVFYVEPDPDMPAAVYGRGASAAYLGEIADARHRRSGTLEKHIRESWQASGVSWEWRLGHGDLDNALVAEARAADLVILSKTLPDEQDAYPVETLVEHLVLQAGCPLILTPETLANPILGRALVAWDGSHGSARAVRDALPLLRRSDHVVVWSWLENDKWKPPLDLAPHLGRHGVKIERDLDQIKLGDAGEALLAAALRHKCDYIVMGAYGHSRLAEFFLGGASRRLIRHSPLPLFLSH
jgi:nucleotide-binding universal stress UspA family protein